MLYYVQNVVSIAECESDKTLHSVVKNSVKRCSADVLLKPNQKVDSY